MERENKRLNSCNRSNGQNNYTLKNTVDNFQLKHSFKIKNYNIESKHTTSPIPKTNVDNITLIKQFKTLNNKNEAHIKIMTNSTDNQNNNATNHKIEQQQSIYELTNAFLYKYETKVKTNVKEHEFETIINKH